MKPFRFSLESVLEYRREIEGEWELKLGEAVGKANKLRAEIASLEKAEKDALVQRQITGAQDAQSWGLYRMRLKQNRERASILLVEAEKKVDEVRKGYLIASRERKSLEKLKEKKKKEYHRYVLREEIKHMDELTAAKAVREDS